MSHSPLDNFDQNACQSLRQSLSRWYRKHARPLPWRETRDPYRIWISEIMLQQTTVKAVIPYYERFLARFPSVHELAAASESEVLQHWEGLGYYSRGRNIHRAAQLLCEERDGQFPNSIEELHALPGIGRYTAGAIRSFAFDRPAPIVEANTLRLYCRLLGYDGDPRGKAGQELLWNLAERLQPARRAGTLNQALMELGATVCTPEPRCDDCPVRRFCDACATGRQNEIPRRVARQAPTQLVEGTLAILRDETVLLRQCPVGERWAGLWDFPRFPISTLRFSGKFVGQHARHATSEARQLSQSATGLPIEDLQHVTEITHTVTRYRIRLLCWQTTINESRSDLQEPATNEFRLPKWRWVQWKELKELPMPVTGRKFATLIGDRDS